MYTSQLEHLTEFSNWCFNNTNNTLELQAHISSYPSAVITPVSLHSNDSNTAVPHSSYLVGSRKLFELWIIWCPNQFLQIEIMESERISSQNINRTYYK